MKIKQIIFPRQYCAEITEIEEQMGDNSVVVETAISTVSCGTERANIMGDANLSIFDEPSVTWPRSAGYSSAGTVVAMGKNVSSVEIGDRVVVYGGSHKDYNIVLEERIVKIEQDNISFEEAAVTYIASFPMAAIRKTRLEIGESALVMGLGVLGQLAVKIAHTAGAVPVIAVDPVKERREDALKNGADYAFDPYEEGFAQKVKDITNGGVNVAIEVTGVGAGFDGALDCMAKFGRIALLGCTRDKNFTIDYYRKIHGPGINIIGAHTLARPEFESYPGYFTHRDDIKALLKLCATGRMNIKDMISRQYPPKMCQEVFDGVMYDKTFPPIVQFDWRK